jgi:hypothetical protein
MFEQKSLRRKDLKAVYWRRMRRQVERWLREMNVGGRDARRGKRRVHWWERNSTVPFGNGCDGCRKKARVDGVCLWAWE